MSDGSILFLCLVSLIIFIALFLLVFTIKRINKLFNYFPSKTINVDITNRKIPDVNEALDYYIINFGVEEIINHLIAIKKWELDIYEKYKDKPKKLNKVLGRIVDNSGRAFNFVFYRTQTRYRQVNYNKIPYKVNNVVYKFFMSEKAILDRVKFLNNHDLYVTYNQFQKKDQRKALTPKLREMIKQRDNYTCQICGKYMPDEVGLHIDHIIPVSKGGKSTPENLRVLCSKCNGKKGNSI